MVVRLPDFDLYHELGVASDARPDEIVAAFRSLARELHPDANPEPGAVERFKRVSAAYRVLMNASERARYDAARVGSAADERTRPEPAPAAPPPPERGTTVFGWHVSARRARTIMGAGIGCLVLATVVSGWVLLDPGTGGDATARDITLWIVVVKLVVGAAAAFVVARRARRGG